MRGEKKEGEKRKKGEPWRVPLRRAVLELTNRCNLRCPHCASDSGKARPGELDGAGWIAVVDELAALGCRELTLIGGEAFLHPDWADVARHARSLDMVLVVVTNGLSLDEAGRSTLLDVGPFLVGVSIDGPDPRRYHAVRGVDGFDRALAFAQDLLADGVPHVNVITTFTRTNLPWFDDFVELLDGGPITWQIQMANKGGSRWDEGLFLRPEDHALLVEKVKALLAERPRFPLRLMDDFGYFPLDPAWAFLHETWSGCMAGRDLVGIRSDGRVSPCLSLGDRFLSAPIPRSSLAEIWRHDPVFAPFRRPPRLSGACASCPEGARCRGGCTAIALSATGRMGDNGRCIRAAECARIGRDVWGG